MLTKEDKRALAFIIGGMVAFALIFGFVCRVYVIPSHAQEIEAEDTSETTVYQYTSEEQEVLDHLLNGEDPVLETPEDTERLLNATGAWLRENTSQEEESSSETETASSTDADWDPRPYLSYPLDQRWIEDSDTVQKGLDDIYRMLLSLRNCALVFMGGLFIVWIHKMIKGVVYRLNGRGLR